MPLTALKPITAAVAATKPSLAICRIVFSPPPKYSPRISAARDPRDDTDEPLSHASRFRERAIAAGSAHPPRDKISAAPPPPPAHRPPPLPPPRRPLAR